MSLMQEEKRGSIQLAEPPERIMENDRVNILRFKYGPGEKAGMHSHPDYVLYVVKGGEVRVCRPFGDVDTMDLEKGEAIFMEAQSHEVTNVGGTDIELVVVELK